jgi:acetate---CoA ligase (ADP-forming)
VRRVRPRRAPGVGIVTAQAGPGLLIADTLGSAGVVAPGLAEATGAGLARLLPPLTWQRNPVDTGRPADTFGEVLALVAADGAIDGLVVYALEEGDAVDPVAALRTPGVAEALPIVFGSGGPRETLDRRQRDLAAVGVPLYRTPERAARAMRALVDDARSRHRAGAGAGAVARPDRTADGVLPTGDRPLDEHEAKTVLEALGVACPLRRVCAGWDDAHAALDALGPPVVVKVLDPGVEHKAAVGGVRRGVYDHAAMDQVLAALAAGPASDRYLVEAEIGAGRDLLVGGTHDRSFGPVVALGWGGTGVERFGRPALRLAPLRAADIEDLVAEVDPGLPAAALAPVVQAVAALLAEPGVAEVDLNPVRLMPWGPVALDALIVRR